MRVAINQPYYYPYAGWFRLFAATDLFVVYDCVQWNRRGRVHRYQKNCKWVTLPIKKTDRDATRIMDMEWKEDCECGFSPLDFIVSTMEDICERLKLPCDMICSSSLNIDAELKGQDRIIAICKKLRATEYINSPGGRDLYDEAAFAKDGIKLKFLPEWQGSYDSILERLTHENPEDIRRQIYDQI